MTERANQNCRNCRFFDRLMGDVGVCLRFPPNMQNEQRSSGQADFFPRVMVNDWCGEWMPHLKPAVTDPSGTVGEAGGGSSELMEDE